MLTPYLQVPSLPIWGRIAIHPFGILVAGGLVLWLKQPWPDLVVGALVALIAVKGGVDILKDANNQKDSAP